MYRFVKIYTNLSNGTFFFASVEEVKTSSDYCINSEHVRYYFTEKHKHSFVVVFLARHVNSILTF